MPAPCVLQFCDHGTGAAIKELCEEQAFLAHFEPMARLFDLQIDMRTVDSAVANLVAEAARARNARASVGLCCTADGVCSQRACWR
eukprot:8564646-Lingulodinium_polyedra.AAC.1